MEFDILSRTAAGTFLQQTPLSEIPGLVNIIELHHVIQLWTEVGLTSNSTVRIVFFSNFERSVKIIERKNTTYIGILANLNIYIAASLRFIVFLFSQGISLIYTISTRWRFRHTTGAEVSAILQAFFKISDQIGHLVRFLTQIRNLWPTGSYEYTAVL